jgi:hypothetical protein
MVTRRRLVRGFVLAAAAVSCTVAIAYQLTGSAAVRQQVINHLQKFFVGGEMALGSARFRLLGGVSVENFTLYRRDDPSQTPLLHVPAGIIYHDKEALSHGKLAVRKLLMRRPRITIVRSADGRWNVAGLLGPVHPELQIPIVEIEQGTIALQISTPHAAAPFTVELQNVNATMVNQPLPVLHIEVRGQAVALGSLALQATWHRTAERLDATADLAPISVTANLLRDLSAFWPGIADQVEQAAGTARVHAGIQYGGTGTPGLRHQVRMEFADGRLDHRDLPLPLDRLNISARCDDGVLAVERLVAKAGPADVSLTCRLRNRDEPSQLVSSRSCPLPPCGGGLGRGVTGGTPHPNPPPQGSREREGNDVVVTGEVKTPHPATLIPSAFDRLAALELTVKQLPVSPELFARLPLAFQKYQDVYSPSGPLNLTVKFDRGGQGGPVLTARLRPERMVGRFDAFPYPIREVRGSLDLTIAGERPPRLDVDLTAEANGRRPVTIQGHVEGDGPAPAYAVVVGGDAIAIDSTLVAALPVKFQNAARSYRPQGRCDITARLNRVAGQTISTQRFTIGFRGDAALCYDLFPVPLERVSGDVDITLGPGAPATSRGMWVCKFNDIRAAYNGARVVLGGEARPTDDGTRVDLTIIGRGVPLDETLAAAFANPRMRLRPVYEMFRPGGRFDFRAQVAHVDRHPAPSDYDIRVQHGGAMIRPTFFPMSLSELAGSFRLTPGRVEIGRYTARHNDTVFEFGGGWVRFGEGWHHADVHDLRAVSLPIDPALIGALPGALQAVCRSLEPEGTLAVDLDRLVVDHPPELPGPAEPPVVYWDGRVRFADASLKTGVAWTGVTGVVASQGRYRGQVLDGVTGHIALDNATIFNQPLAGLHADARVLTDHPHVLQLQLGRAQLFGGQVAGQAHVAFGAGLQYAVDLKAIGVRLEDVARHNRIGANAKMSGLAKAELYLTGTGYGVDELGGGGNVHIPDGKIYNLPLALDLLKVTHLHAPDGTAFEEAHAEFKIQGKRVEVKRFDLLGSAVNLGGKGEMDLDGSNMAMDFYAVWGHLAQILPPGLRDVPPWLSKNLLLLHARGKLGGSMEVRPEVVPVVVDPVRKLVDYARGRTPPGKTPEGARGQKD